MKGLAPFRVDARVQVDYRSSTTGVNCVIGNWLDYRQSIRFSEANCRSHSEALIWAVSLYFYFKPINFRYAIPDHPSVSSGMYPLDGN
jgi:hypothetical protein